MTNPSISCPELKQFSELCDEIRSGSNLNEVTEANCKLIQYRLQCFDLLLQEKELSHELRQHAQFIEMAVGNLIASEEVNFDQTAKLIQLSRQLLEETSFLSDFDCINNISDEGDPYDQYQEVIDLGSPATTISITYSKTAEVPITSPSKYPEGFFDRYQEAIDLGSL